MCLKCGVHSEEKLGINLIRYKLKRLYRVLSVVLKRLHFVLWGSRERTKTFFLVEKHYQIYVLELKQELKPSKEYISVKEAGC